ncbi:YfhJ family protein [Rummeliibacillus stabekisii]|uniref:YfhJ family protein n=1 Tax=Rummeliibacillus TaxID=648802 RepID=UPI00123A28DA|nr:MULTISPECIES: YfhJ family protein [Rummeliibacillus]MCM3317346.1 YfhJ family protein [Rummeliibacillus stabekisii]
MERIINELVAKLQEKNPKISEEKARVWVELLWSDFEATYAKAGYDYQGAEMSEKIISQWIDSYGSQLNEFVARNPKYAHLLNEE